MKGRGGLDYFLSVFNEPTRPDFDNCYTRNLSFE